MIDDFNHELYRKAFALKSNTEWVMIMPNTKSSSMAASATGIVAATMAAGAAIYMINGNTKKGKKRAMKRKAKRTMRNVGQAVNNVVDSVATNLLK